MKTVTINKIKVKIFEEKELREKLDMDEEDIDMVSKYQRIFPELLQAGAEGFCIDARNLHNNLVKNVKGSKIVKGKEKIVIGTKFNDWINKRIKKYSFIENKDFKRVLFLSTVVLH